VIDLSVSTPGQSGFTLLRPEQTGVTFTNSLDEWAGAKNRVLSNGSGVADLEKHLAGLREAAEQVPRPDRLGRLEINWMQLDPVRVSAAEASQYASLGVDRLVVYPLPLEDPAEVAAFLTRHAELG